MWHSKLPRDNWVEFLIDNGLPLDIITGNRLDFIKDLVEDCKSFLTTGKIGLAINYLSLGVHLDKKEFLKRLKREGLLRHSHYFNLRNPVAYIAAHFLKFRLFFGLTEDEVLYFESLINLETYYAEIKKVYQNIIDNLRKYKKAGITIVKSLLILNDYSFLTRTFLEQYSSSDKIDFRFTLEQRSEAVSYLVSIYDELFTITPPDLLLTNKEFLESKKTEALIIQSCQLKQFREKEILIESVGYICNREERRTIIEHKDEQTLKSIELSVIRSMTQSLSDSYRIDAAFKAYPKLKDLADFTHKTFPGLIVFENDQRLPRYIFKLPFEPVWKALNNPIGTFFDDYPVLEFIQNEMSLPLDELDNYQVEEGLSMSDFLKINRFFYFVFEVFSEKLKAMETPQNRMLILNSLLLTVNASKLSEMMQGIVEPEILSKYLQIISWRPGKGEYLDLQHTPVVVHRDLYVISLSLIRISLLVRNTLASMAKKGSNSKALQISLLSQVADQLTGAFVSQGFTCFSELKIYFQGALQDEGDIDFLAFKDGYCFIAECKDVMDSTDSFEYRRIHDYLLKAASQLDYIKSALTDPGYNKKFSSRIGMDISKARGIYYIIVPTARKMYGHHVASYPVRSRHELIRFVTEGEINLKLPHENPMVFNTWQNDNFSISDLIQYCSEESFHSESFNAMEKVERQIGKNVFEGRYVLDLVKFAENMKARFRYVEVEEETPEE